MTEISEFDSTIPEKELRAIIADISEDPYSNSLWDRLAGLASKELSEKMGTSNLDLNLGELVRFGEKLKEVRNFEKKHRLLFEKTSGGFFWYDILLAPANDKMFKPALDEIVQITADGERKFETAIDVGTGSGNTLRMIAPFCQNVIGIDKEGFMLEFSRELGSPDNSTLKEGKADDLPVKDSSVDLAVSNGLLYYLSKSETQEHIREIKRILKPGGFYLVTFPIKKESELISKLEQKALQDAKSMLIYLMSEIATGGGNKDSMNLVDRNAFFLEQGFEIDITKANVDNVHLLTYTKPLARGQQGW